MTEADLARPLEAARAAYEAGDCVRAAAMLDAASRACDEARSRGELLAPAVAARLLALHAACAAAAAAARERLVREMTVAGNARRAVTAYGK